MSWDACKWVYRSKIGRFARAIAWDMAFAADSKTHELTVSVPRLAEKIGISTRQVRRGLRELEDVKALVIVRDGNGGLRPCTYRLCAPVDPIYLEIAEDGTDQAAHASARRLASLGDRDAPDTPSGVGEDTQSAPPPDGESGEPGHDGRGGGTGSPPNLREDSGEEPLTPQPPKGGEVVSPSASKAEPEDFAAFWAPYPGRKMMDRDVAVAAFRQLDRDDQRWARAASPLYAAEIEKWRRKPVDAHRWLERRGFKEFAEAKPAPAPVEHWVTPGSVEFRVRAVLAEITGRSLPMPVERGDPGLKRMVLVFDRALPPEALSLGSFATPDGIVDTSAWKEHEAGTQQSGAWRGRMIAWTGHDAKLHVTETGETKSVEALGKTYTNKVTRSVIRVPQEWPPSKKSTEGGDDHDGGSS